MADRKATLARAGVEPNGLTNQQVQQLRDGRLDPTTGRTSNGRAVTAEQQALYDRYGGARP